MSAILLGLQIQYVKSLTFDHLCQEMIGLNAQFFFNILRPDRNGRSFSDDIFESIISKEFYFPKGTIDTKTSLVLVMTCRQ